MLPSLHELIGMHAMFSRILNTLYSLEACEHDMLACITTEASTDKESFNDSLEYMETLEALYMNVLESYLKTTQKVMDTDGYAKVKTGKSTSCI